MVEDHGQNEMYSRRDVLTGWILGIACLVIFLACPNVKIPNGDALGYSKILDEYARADGTWLYATGVPDSDAGSSGRFRVMQESAGELIRDPGWWVLWHPHHLLYLPLTATIFRLVKDVIPQAGGINFLRWWNAIISAVMVLLFYRLLTRIVPRSLYTLPWCLFFITSVTFFHYSTDGAQYQTPVMLLTCASGSVLAFATGGHPRYLVRAGIWLALAVLFHQLVSVIVPFLLLAVFFLLRGMWKEGRGISRGWFWGMAGIATGIPVLVYVLIAALALGPRGEFSFDGLIDYATLYAHQPGYWAWSAWDGFTWNLMTYVGFYFGDSRTWEMFFLNVWFTALVIMLPTVWVIGIINMRKLPPLMRWWMIWCLSWILPLLIFLSFWSPGHDFYHLFLTIPLGCLAVIGAESSQYQGLRGTVDIWLFRGWCVIAIAVNLPLSLEGCGWWTG